MHFRQILSRLIGVPFSEPNSHAGFEAESPASGFVSDEGMRRRASANESARAIKFGNASEA